MSPPSLPPPCEIVQENMPSHHLRAQHSGPRFDRNLYLAIYCRTGAMPSKGKAIRWQNVHVVACKCCKHALRNPSFALNINNVYKSVWNH
jgi:hypothetical protein